MPDVSEVKPQVVLTEEGRNRIVRPALNRKLRKLMYLYAAEANQDYPIGYFADILGTSPKTLTRMLRNEQKWTLHDFRLLRSVLGSEVVKLATEYMEGK
jgi:hypothetical protein